jgi:hypothetical protein
LARVSAWNEERKFCVQQTYGDSYQAAWDLTPLDLPSILIDEITELTEGALSRIGNRNMYGNARQYEAGKRQLRTLSQFRKFNASMAVLGAAATGFVIGANVYCGTGLKDVY